MLLTPLPWLKNGSWALPVLTALCPSQRYWEERLAPRGHKKLMGWAGQLFIWLARYAKPFDRQVFLAGDGSYATYELMGRATKYGVGLIARMRLDARLFHLPPRPVSGKRAPKPKIGKRILGMVNRLNDGRVKWKEVVFDQWYGRKNKKMLITSGVAIWSCRSDQKIKLKWVLIKDPDDQLDPSCSPVPILTPKL